MRQKHIEVTGLELPYASRHAAGQALSHYLEPYRARRDLLVLALSPGGVPVAYEIAESLKAPLDLVLVGKVGFPGHSEMAVGAVTSNGIEVFNDELISRLNIPDKVLEQAVERTLTELHATESVYRENRSRSRLQGRWVLIADDGVATGAMVRAAIAAVLKERAAGVALAIPVAEVRIIQSLQGEGIDVICPSQVDAFGNASQWFSDFREPTEDEVRRLLRKAGRQAGEGNRHAART